MAETHHEGQWREPEAALREQEAQLHALLQAAARVCSDATRPTLLTVRVPPDPAPAPAARPTQRRPPRGARVPRQAARAQTQVLAQARQTLRTLIAAYGAAVVWQEVVAPVYADQPAGPSPAAPANAMPLSAEEMSQVFGVLVVERP